MPDAPPDRDVRWTTLGQVHLPAGEEEGVYVCLKEQYEIIDPELPYEERFRTVRHVLDVHYADAGRDRVQMDLTGSDALELAAMFLRFGRARVTDADLMDPTRESAT